ncbi:hypothetical protein P691DRAFT_806567 [Macrolepiota fuliginosa MF-IS2]|uniref:RING-type domain-containing protein n=1 Tax=Macrolepiota fuliginosa MF-IS2 TaxID=1400762 RepID=A0A9P5X723_9AGAR|nr:hypothetical protein P691DRAFT_806567 [Macrolepiota fuliginosa MF-IS2]
MAASFSVRGECKICLDEKLEIEAFRVFPCGHCFCKSCIHDLYSRGERRKTPCPLCRKPWFKNDANQLVFHPVIVDPSGSSIEYVIDGINRMNETCKTISVKRAHTKLTKAAENIEEANADRLRKAIEDFAQRIIPLFEELDLGRRRIQELEENQRNDSLDLATKRHRLESLEKETSSLRKSNETLQINYLQALESAGTLRVKAEELQSNLSDARKNLATKEDEHRRAMDSIGRFKSSDAAKSKKLKTLKKEVDELAIKLQEKENMVEEQSSLMDLDHDLPLTATGPLSSTHSSGLSSLRVHSKEEGWVDVGNFEFEGMPRPGFGSAWNIANKKVNSVLKKPQPSGSKANPKFPLNLDAKGRPTIAVHVGPKSTIRVGQPF